MKKRASVPALPVTKSHSTRGASSSERWLNCPGSIALGEKAPPAGEGRYAKEGTDAHFCLETLLRNPEKRLSTADVLRKKYGAEMVEFALDACQTIDRIRPKGAELLVETKVDLYHIDASMFGTLDVAIVEEFGTLHIIDYKYGAGIPVDAFYNSQLIYYAIGIAKEYHYNFDRVLISIIQPRAEHPDGPFRTWETTVENLLEWEKIFRDGVARTYEPDAPRVPGDWCRFCPAAVICPEISLRAMEAAKIDFDPIESTVLVPAASDVGVNLADLGKMLVAADRIEKWISELRNHAERVLRRGEEVEGWKLVQKRSIRRWKDVETASKAAKKIFGSTAFSEPELLSPAQLEAAAKKIDGIETALEFTEKYTTAESSGVTLVPESDKRPAVKAIEAEFSVLEDESGISEKPAQTISKEKKRKK